jgi:hypothetical protein
MPGQWRRRAGGSPPTPRLANAGRDLNWMIGNLRCVGGVHGASGPVAAGVPPRAGFRTPRRDRRTHATKGSCEQRRSQAAGSDQ